MRGFILCPKKVLAMRIKTVQAPNGTCTPNTNSKRIYLFSRSFFFIARQTSSASSAVTALACSPNTCG